MYKKKKYINNKIIRKKSTILKRIKNIRLELNYGGITNIVKEGKEIGFYKIIIERYGAYNMNEFLNGFVLFYTKKCKFKFLT